MNRQYKTISIRGAVTVEENSGDTIKAATVELLSNILNKNKIEQDDIISVIFTMTQDLTAEFPAKAARIDLGWDDISMLCAQEVAVPGSIPMCIRVLLTINSTLNKNEIRHVYLGNAKKLRPDLFQ